MKKSRPPTLTQAARIVGVSVPKLRRLMIEAGVQKILIDGVARIDPVDMLVLHQLARRKSDLTTGPAPDDEVPPGTAEGDSYLTVAQAAKLMQFSKRHVYRMIDDGLIRAKRFGRSLRIRRGDLGL